MKKFLFLHSISISQCDQLFMHLWKLITNQKEFKNQLKPQKNKNTARCLSFQVKYRSKKHYDMFRVSKIANSEAKSIMVLAISSGGAFEMKSFISAWSIKWFGFARIEGFM